MNILDLLSSRLAVKRLANKDGGEYHCGCLKCGGVDRFMFWPQAGNFYCRHCGWRGDVITILREIDGLTFREAAALVGKELPETDHERRARERAVKESLLISYARWCAVQLVFWCNTYRELTDEIAVVEIGYRATTIHPEFYTKAEADYWATRLASLYDVLPQVEHRCDLLTYERHAAERWAWWREDRQ